MVSTFAKYVEIWEKKKAKNYDLIISNEEIRRSVSATFKKYNLGRTNALTRVALESAYTDGGIWLKSILDTIENNVTSVEKELEISSHQELDY